MPYDDLDRDILKGGKPTLPMKRFAQAILATLKPYRCPPHYFIAMHVVPTMENLCHVM